jgi:hypothetical protein
MRLLILALLLCSTACVHAQDFDIKAIEEQALLLKPERTAVVMCLSDVVDRAKAQGSAEAEFKETLLKSCLDEREALRKALLDRLVPVVGVEPGKREDVAAWASQQLLIPIYNEFTARSPYRYRLKDAERAKTRTPEDLALKASRENYGECLATFAANARAGNVSSDDFRKSLNRACLAEADAVHQAELRVWDTYVNPPSNREAAGKTAITIAKTNAAQEYRAKSR